MKLKQIDSMQVNNNLLELISPQGIKLNPNTIQIGENLSKYFYIKDYTSTVNLGWLTQILNILGAIVTINITPVDTQEFVANLDKGMQSNISIFNSTRSEVEKTRAEIGLSQSKNIVEDITVNLSTYVDVSMLIRISGKNEVELEKNCNLLRNKISTLGFKLRVPSFLTQEAFNQNSPFSIQDEEILNISNKRMSLKTLMGGLPFSGTGFIDTSGWILGFDESGRMINVDFFLKDRDRTTSNIVVVGSSGSGKSYALKKLLLNSYVDGTKIVIIDFESEYTEMAKRIDNSKLIDCSGGFGENVAKINPLQISPIYENDEDEYIAGKSELSIHIHFLQTFFQLYYPDITTRESSILNEVLEELYRNFNIDWNTRIINLKNTDFPIMEDLYNLLVKKHEENPNEIEIDNLKNIVRSLAIGADSDSFNGYTSVEADSNFIVLDTHMIQGTNTRLRRTQYFNILRFCQDIAFKDKNERVFIVCDEAHILCDTKNPEALDFLKNMSKRARKYESGIIVATQSIIDFLHDGIKEYGQALFDNATYKLILGMDGKNLEQAEKLFNLNQAQKNILASKIKGQGLFIIGTVPVFIRITSFNWEKPFLIGGGR